MSSDRADASTVLAALDVLLDGARHASSDALPDLLAAAGRTMGWQVVAHLVTFDQCRLVPLGAEGTTRAVDDEAGAGLAFRSMAPTTDADGDHWIPLLDGAERLGVLRVRALPGGPDPRDRAADLGRLASLTGHLVAVLSPSGDAITRVRGAGDRRVEAEIIWNLLPPLTFTAPDVVISGLLEPCEKVAGDLFDYAVEGTTAQFAILDGTGHDLRAGLLASVALATYRNHRRRGADLATCGRMIDETMHGHTDGAGYATGVLARLDTATGRFDYLNAGHPHPLLLRGGRVVRALEHPGRGMFGLGAQDLGTGHEQLEPGDRVILYTDGITEARADDGTFFGLDRLVTLLEEHAAAQRPAPETLRLVVRSVLEHHRGVLRDDATLMIIEWAPPERREVRPGHVG